MSEVVIHAHGTLTPFLPGIAVMTGEMEREGVREKGEGGIRKRRKAEIEGGGMG